jgi:hypothetical protein
MSCCGASGRPVAEAPGGRLYITVVITIVAVVCCSPAWAQRSPRLAIGTITTQLM